MTAYWDNWARVISGLEEAIKNKKDTELLIMAVSNLIEDLHDYDHQHGGHDLDNWFQERKHMNFLLERLRKET